MKELILVRHAKSSWDNAALTDFERPLNERGLRDAERLSGIIAQRNDIHPDLIISSPATRTMETAHFFAKALNVAPDNFQSQSRLYNGTPQVLTQIIKNISDKYQQVFLFAHNTGLTDFVNSLTNVHVDNLPTCGVFAVKIQTDLWRDFSKAEKKFWFFDYPKIHFI